MLVQAGSLLRQFPGVGKVRNRGQVGPQIYDLGAGIGSGTAQKQTYFPGFSGVPSAGRHST